MTGARPDSRDTADEALSSDQARRFYNWLGARHDLGARYERRAKDLGLAQLAVTPGERVLNVGAGTGKEHRLLAEATGAGGCAVAVDLSRTMLDLARERTGSPAVEADALTLPFPDGAFDALYCSYVLDLMPGPLLPAALREFRRVMRSGGRLALISLTAGIDLPSQIVMGLWRIVYQASPIFLGGCRPIRLPELVFESGLSLRARQIVVQGGVPSDVVLALRP